MFRAAAKERRTGKRARPRKEEDFFEADGRLNE